MSSALSLIVLCVVVLGVLCCIVLQVYSMRRGTGTNTNYLNDLIESIEGAVAIVNPQGHLVHANTEFVKSFNINTSEQSLYDQTVGSVLRTSIEDIQEQDNYAVINPLEDSDEGAITIKMSKFIDPNSNPHYMLKVSSVHPEQGQQYSADFIYNNDIVTNLPLRKTFERTLDKKIIEIENGRPQLIAIYVLAIDQFREFNERFRYEAGNKILSEIAGNIKNIVGESDVVARLEGNRIAVAHPIKRSAEANGFAQLLLSASGDGLSEGDRKIDSSMSAGVALYPGDGNTAASLLKDADIALRSVTSELRKGEVIFYGRLDENVRTGSTLSKSTLLMAIEQGSLELSYQAVLDLPKENIFSFEVFTTLKRSDVDAFVGHDRLIELSEELGVQQEYFIFIFEGALTEYSKTDFKGCVGINIPSTLLEKPGFVDAAEDILVDKELPGDRIIFEVSGRGIARVTDGLRDNLRRLAELGISVYIDDFGSLTCNLNTIEELPIKGVKIDAGVCDGVHSSDSKMEKLNVLSSVAEKMKLDVIYEGVNAKEDAECIASTGLKKVQGKYYSIRTQAFQLQEGNLRSVKG